MGETSTSLRGPGGARSAETESGGHSACLGAGMCCKPQGRPPSEAAGLPDRAQPPPHPVGPGKRLLNRFKRLVEQTHVRPFLGRRGSRCPPGPALPATDCAAAGRGKPSASAPTCMRRPRGLHRRRPAAPRPRHFLSALNFGMGCPARTLGHREETRPAEGARRGGQEAGGARGQRGQGGEQQEEKRRRQKRGERS